MADFCLQCSATIFCAEAGQNDFVGLCGEQEMVPVLCEGCGVTVVDKDGRCIAVGCLENHNPPTEAVVT